WDRPLATRRAALLLTAPCSCKRAAATRSYVDDLLAARSGLLASLNARRVRRTRAWSLGRRRALAIGCATLRSRRQGAWCVRAGLSLDYCAPRASAAACSRGKISEHSDIGKALRLLARHAHACTDCRGALGFCIRKVSPRLFTCWRDEQETSRGHHLAQAMD